MAPDRYVKWWTLARCGQEFLWAVETKRNKRPLLITQVARHQRYIRSTIHLLCCQQHLRYTYASQFDALTPYLST